MSEDARGLPKCEEMTPLSKCAAVGRVEQELFVLLGKALARGTTRRLQFIADSDGWLHSIVLHRR